MIDAKTLEFIPQKASLMFGNNDSEDEDKIKFYFEGRAGWLSSSSHKKCRLKVWEADADKEYREINHPSKKVIRYGDAELVMPFEHIIREETIEIILYLKHHGIKALRHLVDKAFFPPNAEMIVYFEIIGLKKGNVPVLDPDFEDFLPEKSVPIIGYSFAIRSQGYGD